MLAYQLVRVYFDHSGCDYAILVAVYGDHDDRKVQKTRIKCLTCMSRVPIATSGLVSFVSTEATVGGDKCDGIAAHPPGQLNNSNVDCWQTANKHFTRIPNASNLFSCNHDHIHGHIKP